MIDACRVEWKAPHRISLRLFRDIQSDRGQLDDPQPPSARVLAPQLSRQADGFGSALPALATPVGTHLDTIADPRPGVTDRRTAEGTCASIAQGDRVVGVQTFSNLRANPGFGEPGVMEVGRDRVVVPLDRSLDGAALLSEKCEAACHPADSGRLTAETISAMNSCARSNDVWWKVRTASGTTGWMSSKFLSPRAACPGDEPPVRARRGVTRPPRYAITGQEPESSTGQESRT
ncbi:SH3 domain-containing protein [Mameliella alba]|uniref:SH3b domain-containing protein n=1 Tax=Mameliella alba TaxID=561184 RepID=A0A0B3SUU5_9RHOB|nr:SH3 domain-containing protein [Mameliella alba]KHQ54224.1 hypothetical protein OA50_00815 [Mameliella alba]